MPRPNKGYVLKWCPSNKGGPESYHIIWFERGQRRMHSTGVVERGQLDKAEAYRAAWVTARQRPTGPSEANAIKIATVLDFYAREHGPHTEDPARIGYAIKALLPFWGELTVDKIKGETCRRYVRERNKADGTVRRELLTLAAAVNHCHREGYLTSAPRVWLPPKSQHRERWLTRDEAAALIRAARNEPKAKEHLPLFIAIGLRSGARKRAILTLQWIPNTTGGHVDLERGLIDFNPVRRRKTNKRRAIIPIPKILMPRLRRARRLNKRFVIEIDGEPVKNIRRSWKTARNAAELGDDVLPHILRHTAATWLAQSGVDKWQALGWLEMTAETWEKNYAHHHPDHLEEARKAVDRPRRRIDTTAV